MKKIVIIICLGLLSLFLIYFQVKKNKAISLLNEVIYESQNSLNRKKLLGIQRDYFLSLCTKSNGSTISEQLVLKNYRGEEFIINDILSSEKLVFRYSELHCDVCVDEQIKSLKKYKEKIGSDNILILADYNNIKNLALFKRLNSIELPIFKLSKKLNLELDEKDFPYFFVIDSSFIARDFFIPIKEINGYTDNYLKIIYEKHFKNK